jgi:CheY-like chemotaxis protein
MIENFAVKTMDTSTRILLVDDEQDILDLGLTILQDAGFETVSAVNGDIAEILLEQGIPFDVLVTDIVFPGILDGFSLARRAKQLQPKIRIVYTTGFGATANVRSRGAPFGEVLTKPWRPTDLLHCVRFASCSAAP